MSTSDAVVRPALATSFGAWVARHRGVQPLTREAYEKAVTNLVANLGEDPETYTARAIHAYVVKWGRGHGVATTKLRNSITRSFLKYLIAEGRCSVGLDTAVPKVPAWRLSTLPRYISADAMDRLVATCTGDTAQAVRDRAVLLLLTRFGLRASEVLALRLEDICWESGSFLVRGKGRKDAVLPLPQDVGNALSRYIEGYRPPHPDSRVFFRLRAPVRPLGCAVAVSGIVVRAIRHAGLTDVPIRGAHLLRHSAATAMVRSGVSLADVGAVLRHSSPETTALYAKVDVGMLRNIARPWPTTAGAQ